MAQRSRETNRLYMKNYRIKNAVKMRKIYLAAAKIKYKKNREKLDKYKEGKPCIDCGIVFPTCCMDFDHKPRSKKIKSVSGMCSSYNWTSIQKEIRKCDLVCANCHRIRTHITRRKKRGSKT